MITFDEALNIVTSVEFKPENESVGFQSSLNRVLAENIHSDMDMPPFHKSAVDGYACRKVDIDSILEVIEMIPAGKAPEKTIGKNQCARIMTGAPMPEGADSVIMVEDVEELEMNKIRYIREKVKDNICYRGEDIRAGEVVLKKGTLVKPQHIAVMATAGCVQPIVYRKVRVGVISTGDELVEPDIQPEISQIRNSNAYQLMAQIEKNGAIGNYYGIAMDTEASTREKITTSFQKNDIILLTGGVSMGDYDYVPAVLKDLGVEILFRSIAVQPGRPTVFGTASQRFVFGLPGNPVSSFVQFEMLVKPLIYVLSGHPYAPLILQLPIAKPYTRKRSTRLSWLPVRINENSEVEPLEYHGSAHINALTVADGLISIPIGKTMLSKGEMVDVRQI